MAPKKAVPVTKEEVPATAEAETKATKPPKSTKLKTLVHPSTLVMVVEALKKNSEKKGTSVQAIRTRILAAHPTVDPVRLKFLLRAALNKGIEKGILVRPPNSSATGATGRFKLAKPLPKTKEGSNLSENVDPNGLPKEKPKKKVEKVAKPTESKPKESKDEKPEKKSETASKKEKSSEKPKASKPKKEPEEKPKGSAAPKKPKAKTAVDGETKTKKEPAKKEKAETTKKEKAETTKKEKAETTKKEKAETTKKGGKAETAEKVDTAEKETTKDKESEENANAKSSKKGKK